MSNHYYLFIIIVAPSLAVQNSEVFTSVGQPTILLCDVNGTPMPEVLWSRDGETLQGHEYKILADGSLYIMDTDLKDDGRYIVSAYNDGGTVEESVRVVVIAPLPPERKSTFSPYLYHCNPPTLIPQFSPLLIVSIYPSPFITHPHVFLSY